MRTATLANHFPCLHRLTRSYSRSTSRVKAMTEQQEVRVFSRRDDPQAAEEVCKTLGQAMAGDPGNAVLCPYPDEFCPRWYAIGHNYTLSKPDVRMLYSIQDHACISFAYWYPEDKGELPETSPEFIDLSKWRRQGAEADQIFRELFAFLDEGKEEFLKEHGPFLYIAFLSTRPDSQGNGLGAQLLSHLTGLADAQGKWTYLEASSEANARLYERHGFQRLPGQRSWSLPEVPGQALTLTPMGRPPRK